MSIYDDKEVKKMINRAIKDSEKELNNTPRHLLDVGNPNHPIYDLHLLGENYKDFLRRQYK